MYNYHNNLTQAIKKILKNENCIVELISDDEENENIYTIKNESEIPSQATIKKSLGLSGTVRGFKLDDEGMYIDPPILDDVFDFSSKNRKEEPLPDRSTAQTDSQTNQIVSLITEVLTHAHKEAEKTNTQVQANLISSIEERLKAQMEASQIIQKANEKAREIENESRLKAIEEEKKREIEKIYVKMEEIKNEKEDPEGKKYVELATKGLSFVANSIQAFGIGENNHEKFVTGLANIVQMVREKRVN